MGFSKGLNELIHLKSLEEYLTFNNLFCCMDNSGIHQDRELKSSQMGRKIRILFW